MTDIRRTLLWVIFTMSLIFLWDAWNQHTGQPSFFGAPPRPTTPVAQEGSAPSPDAGAAAVPAPAASAGPAGPAGSPPAAVAAAGSAPVAAPAAATARTDLIEVETDVVKARFDPQGASLVYLELLTQRDLVDRSRNVVLLDISSQRVYMAQTGVVGPAAYPTHLTPMTLRSPQRRLAPGADSLVLQFESEPVGGLQYIKTYTLRRGQHDVAVSHEVVNVGSAPAQPQIYLQLVRDGNPPPGESSFYFTFTGPAVYTEATKFSKIDFSDVERGRAQTAPPSQDGWVAMVQHYFASAWLVTEARMREFYARKVDTNLYAVGMIVPLGELAPGARQRLDTVLFAGPQEEKKLEALAPGLELVKDYGWFTILSKPLFWLLDKLHSVLGNWGWSIVALVVLLKIAFFQLNAAAYKSMAKMKKVAPRVTELRERYKDNPQQMQQEMMRIYKEEKVNPLGGCLPILIQIPVFIALYWVLLSSVEMRDAPWILWITDLSAKDPYYILPVLMTASTLLQTWLNPTPPDPLQARLMWIMPLVFSIFFFLFPAGLVLYWLTNNILSIAQQYVINKRLGVLK